MAASNTLKSREITIRNSTPKRLPLFQAKAKRIIPGIIKRLGGRKACSIGVVILTDLEIKRLNKRHLGKNLPTDVIAFSYSDTSFDIAISYDTAARNAKAYRTTTEKEMLLYLIHGLLHVFGYNDDTPEAKKKMWKKQSEIFRQLVTSGQ